MESLEIVGNPKVKKVIVFQRVQSGSADCYTHDELLLGSGRHRLNNSRGRDLIRIETGWNSWLDCLESKIRISLGWKGVDFFAVLCRLAASHYGFFAQRMSKKERAGRFGFAASCRCFDGPYDARHFGFGCLPYFWPSSCLVSGYGLFCKRLLATDVFEGCAADHRPAVLVPSINEVSPQKPQRAVNRAWATNWIVIIESDDFFFAHYNFD